MSAHPAPDEMARAAYKNTRFHSPVAESAAIKDYAAGVAAERARVAAWLRSLGQPVNGRAPHVEHPSILANRLEGRERW